MPPCDEDGADRAETAAESAAPAETETREQAKQHLRAALSATEQSAKQYHVRQALQLLTLGRR
ncbi:hypothetical protein [Halorussus sp. AFM4]|uniref:hypothetical protein n=1 Tax=Halorussus sp. AFM4 TaxID=3421651 RepID=UPI003EC06CA3